MLIGEVAQPVPVHRTFDYEIPTALAAAAKPGARVRAPFGPRTLVGVIRSVRQGEPQRPLKRLIAVLDREPILSADQLELADWLARRYGAAPGESVKALAPIFIKSLEEPADAASVVIARPQAGSAAPITLTAGQAAAVERLSAQLESKAHGAFLLYGVPASGKTEVYIRLMRQAIAAGGQCLYLLPEISLTQPFFDELAKRAGFSVAVWHSRLTPKQRRQVWLGLRRGEIQAVIGARSAALLPFKDLRLAVVDEEHDESYKQDTQAPLYHAREVVLERARRAGAVAVLGSATPSLESFALARAGQAELLNLPERVSPLAAPTVEIVEKPLRGCLSDVLLGKIKERLARREQIILLVNRRGYSNFVICRKCGWVCRCLGCSIAFIHHEEGQDLYALRCHHCGGRSAVPPYCPQCKSAVTYAGIGTQKVVAEVKAALPGARVLRMDSDTVGKEKASQKDAKLYERFLSRQADILVGTKLVAKGYHFPDVTLVGVVDADTMLQMPDFRAAERTVQLLLQAAGRAGRADKPGQVVLQSSQPEHYAIQAVARSDYLRYADHELEFRRELRYPPGAGLIRLVYLSSDETLAARAAEDQAALLRSQGGGVLEVLGPAPAVYHKLRGNFRQHILVKVDAAAQEGLLRELVGAALPAQVKRQIQSDPYDLF